jgi:radical SAM superfamily enzyme YgiQ (UPF0313 family)
MIDDDNHPRTDRRQPLMLLTATASGESAMNVLLVYPTLPLSFWSYPDSIGLYGVKALFAPPGPLTVAALLPREWNARFVDLNIREISEEDWRWSDIIMLSGMIAQRQGFREIIAAARLDGKMTVAGGPYATLMADDLISDGCDLVVRGEAESSIDRVVEAIHSRQSGLIIDSAGWPDLSASPLPRYDLIRMDEYLQFIIQTTRGCPYSCEFCSISDLNGRTPRFKPPELVLAELDHLYGLGFRGDVFVADDNFIASPANAKAICREMIEWNRRHGEPFGFTAQTSVNLAQDLEMIDLMTAANFGEVFIGIETPDQDILAACRKYHNIASPLLDSIDTITRNGLSVTGSFIIGFDNERKGAGRRICDFVDRTNIPIVMPNVLSAPPRSKLWLRIKDEGRSLDDNLAYHSGESNVCLPNFTPTRPVEEIMEEYVGIWEYLYEPRRFLQRTYQYCLAVRPTRRALAEASRTGSTPNPPARQVPLKKRLRETVVFLRHVWNHGVLAAHRRLFWRQLIGMWKNNPSRLRKYIIHCICGESHMRMARNIRQKIQALLADRARDAIVSPGVGQNPQP